MDTVDFHQGKAAGA